MKQARALVGVALGIGLATPAVAAGDNAMKVCGAKYQAAKTAKTLPPGQTWNQFLSQCRASMKTVSSTTTKTTTTRTTASPAQLAMRSRQQACAKQWQADKAAHKLAAGQTWPKYWSQCNARMKG